MDSEYEAVYFQMLTQKMSCLFRVTDFLEVRIRPRVRSVFNKVPLHSPASRLAIRQPRTVVNLRHHKRLLDLQLFHLPYVAIRKLVSPLVSDKGREYGHPFLKQGHRYGFGEVLSFLRVGSYVGCKFQLLRFQLEFARLLASSPLVNVLLLLDLRC